MTPLVFFTTAAGTRLIASGLVHGVSLSRIVHWIIAYTARSALSTDCPVSVEKDPQHGPLIGQLLARLRILSDHKSKRDRTISKLLAKQPTCGYITGFRQIKPTVIISRVCLVCGVYETEKS
jgi:hypothetical protein